jgi:peptidyl-tRNA hydrolase, PTH1 family
MRIVAGLGNPGAQYRKNRHNVGFHVADLLATRWSAPPLKEKFSALQAKASFRGEDVVLLEPQTFMNLSGESLQKAMAFYKVDLADVIVVHDELDLAWRDVRVKIGGGHAGHNGLRSIIQHCGGPDFTRVRIGIGKPPRGSTESWVLGDFDAMESAELPGVLEAAALSVEAVLEHGAAAAMNRLHAPAKKPQKPLT